MKNNVILTRVFQVWATILGSTLISAVVILTIQLIKYGV
jgi:hypothetical protein